jgi:hypothetical protein
MGQVVYQPNLFIANIGIDSTDAVGVAPNAVDFNLALLAAITKPALLDNDQSYVTSKLNVVFGKSFTVRFPVNTSHGTISQVRIVWRIAPFGVFGQLGGARSYHIIDGLHIEQSGGEINYALNQGVTAAPYLGPAVWVTNTVTLATDPSTGLAWTQAGLTSLLANGLTFFFPPLDGNNTGAAISNVYIEPVGVSPVPGQGRTSLGPEHHELAYVCVLCGIPKHLRDLVKPRDPRHPQYNQWVCKDDFDVIDPEPTSPTFLDGDLSEEPD